MLVDKVRCDEVRNNRFLGLTHCSSLPIAFLRVIIPRSYRSPRQWSALPVTTEGLGFCTKLNLNLYYFDIPSSVSAIFYGASAHVTTGLRFLLYKMREIWEKFCIGRHGL